MSMHIVEYAYREIGVGKFDLDPNMTPEEKSEEALSQIVEENYFEDTNQVQILDIKEING